MQQPPNTPPPHVPLSTNSQTSSAPQWDVAVLPPGIPTAQPPYQDRHDLIQQQSTTGPPPPGHLVSANLKSDARGPEWYAGFTAGCAFATRPPGGSLSPPQEREPEWNMGFFAGCAFGSRTSRGPPPNVSRMQPNSTGSLIKAAPSIPTVIVPNPRARSLPTADDPDSQSTLSLSPQTSQGPNAQALDHQSQAQSGLSTTQMIAYNNLPNGSHSNTTSPPKESAFGANNNTSTSSNVGPIRRKGGRMKHMCNVCRREFSGKYRLEEHMPLHNDGATAHVCHFRGCGETYFDEPSVKRHYNKIHRRS
ncbi:hypothetical protein B0J17DRAFT_411895 [Rhizoctonia solani]|nr:hypothetical protein B0J17DRAFT_411895 [Rhizoctonia solani]